MAIDQRTIDFEKLKKPNDKKLFPGDDTYGVIGIPDIPSLQTLDMQTKFDELSKDLIIPEYNALVEDIKTDYVSKILLDETIEKIGSGDMREIDYVDEGGTKQVLSSKQADNGLKLYEFNRTEARFSIETQPETTKILVLAARDSNGFNDEYYVGGERYWAQKSNAKPLENGYVLSGKKALAAVNPTIKNITFFSGNVAQAGYSFESSTHTLLNLATTDVYYAEFENSSLIEEGQTIKIQDISEPFSVYNPDGQFLTTDAVINQSGELYFANAIRLVVKIDTGNKRIDVVVKNPEADTEFLRTKGVVELNGFGDNIRFIPTEDFNIDDEIKVNGLLATTINSGGETTVFGYLKQNVIAMMKREYQTFEEEQEVTRVYLYPFGQGYDDIPDGKLVLPIDDHSIWLRCAGIRQKLTLTEIMENEAILTNLINSENALEYMYRSLAIIQQTVLNTPLARAILDASLPRTIPNMTSWNSPTGFVSPSAHYVVFDASTTTQVDVISEQTVSTIYEFNDAIWLYKFQSTLSMYKYDSATSPNFVVELHSSVDGVEWNYIGQDSYKNKLSQVYITTPSTKVKYIKVVAYLTYTYLSHTGWLKDFRVYGK